MTSEPLCFVISQLANLVESLFALVNEEGHRGRVSSAELSNIQSTFRSCYADIRDLISETWFGELDNNSFLLSSDIDDKACFDICRKWVLIRYQALTMCRQFRSDGLFIIPDNQGYLLTSCGNSAKSLRTSHGANRAISITTQASSDIRYKDHQMYVELPEKEAVRYRELSAIIRWAQTDIRRLLILLGSKREADPSTRWFPEP